MKRVCWFFLAGLCILFSENAAASDVSDFFRGVQTSDAAISPNGARIVVAENVNGHARIRLFENGANRLVLDAKEQLEVDESYVRSVQWIDNRHVAFGVSEQREAIAELIDTKISTKLYVADVDDSHARVPIYEVKTSGYLIHPLPEENHTFLYSKSGSFSRVYKLDVTNLNMLGAKMTRRTLVDGGQFTGANVVASYEGLVLRWFADEGGEIESALALSKELGIAIVNYDAESKVWSTLRSWTFDDSENDDQYEEILIPLAAGPGTDQFYAVHEQEGQTDGLYLVNFSNDERQLIYRDPSSNIRRVQVDRRTREVRSIGLADAGDIRSIYLQPAQATMAAEIERRLPDKFINIVDESVDGDTLVLASHSFSDPGTFYRWHQPSESLFRIAEAMPWLDAGDMATVEIGSVISHGLDIPYLVTIPANANTPYPLVTLPHGGPIGVVDNRSFDPIAQMLASKGYAVLQVNYRGSAGFDDAFLEAGKREFGGKILDDISAAVKAVKARPDIDDSRVCIVGSSYGGYAALSLGIRNRDGYRCIASISGVTDVQLMAASRTIDQDQREWLYKYVGDPEVDFDELIAMSPAYKADELELPLFIAHGSDDVAVDLEHASRLRFSLEHFGKDYEYLEMEGMGHGPSEIEEASKLYSALLAFLDKNLQ